MRFQGGGARAGEMAHLLKAMLTTINIREEVLPDSAGPDVMNKQRTDGRCQQ